MTRSEALLPHNLMQHIEFEEMALIPSESMIINMVGLKTVYFQYGFMAIQIVIQIQFVPL